MGEKASVYSHECGRHEPSARGVMTCGDSTLQQTSRPAQRPPPPAAEMRQPLIPYAPQTMGVSRPQLLAQAPHLPCWLMQWAPGLLPRHWPPTQVVSRLLHVAVGALGHPDEHTVGRHAQPPEP